MSIEVEKINENRFRLNVKGYVCPHPSLYTLRALEKLKPGDILEVLLDNQPSSKTIPEIVSSKGYDVLSVTKGEEANWMITIKKKG